MEKGCGLLVTGGGGLLATAVRELRPDAHFLTRADGDLADLCQARRLFRALRPRRILHLAARVAGVKTNAERGADLLTENVQLNSNVLAAARECGAERLVAVLSSCAFGYHSDRPSSEADLHEGKIFEGNLGYGTSKRLLDLGARLFAKQYGSRFSTVTPVTMYGPADNFDVEEGHVIGALIQKCHLAAERGEALDVWGSGRAVRQFVYAPDAARVVLENLDSWHGPETMVIAPDGGISIRDLVARVVAASGFTGEVRFDASKPEGQLSKVLESGTFRARHPAFRFTPLEEGLERTVRWFRENRARAKGAAALPTLATGGEARREGIPCPR